MTETSAADDRSAIVQLLTGLHERGLTEHLHWSSAVDVTRIALAAIDQYALAAATPNGPVEELVFDGSLSAGQEIRARAALAAHPPFGADGRFKVIDEIAAYIRDGSLPELRAEPATVERVARAIHNGRWRTADTADARWRDADEREYAYALAKAAIDAYHTRPASDEHDDGHALDRRRAPKRS